MSMTTTIETEENQPVDKIDTIEKVIKILVHKNKEPIGSKFSWKQVDHQVHKELLYRIAEELNVSNPRLIASKDLEKHSFQFLNNLPLNGLYFYYKNRLPRKKNVHVITGICDMFSVPPVNLEDWVYYIQHNNLHSWGNIPVEIRRQVLLLACNELGCSHPIMMNYDDFTAKLKFLNGKSLSGFYNYYNKRTKTLRGSVIKQMCDALEIPIDQEDWIAYITSSSVNTFWDVIPSATMRSFLFEAAHELGYTNPRMMATEDLKIPLDFLRNMTFYSFASRFMGVDKKGVRLIDYICNHYQVPELTYEEWIFLASHQTNFQWERFPKVYLKRILCIRARELDKDNPRMLRYEDFLKPFALLGNKNLTGLYNYYLTVKEDRSIDTINYLCNLCKIPPMNIDHWVRIMSRLDSKVSWATVSDDVKKEILIQAAYELGYKSPRFMEYNDFCNVKFRFLNNRTLAGLYSHYSTKLSDICDTQSSILQYIFDEIGLERLTLTDWYEVIGQSNIVRWETIPIRVQREIVVKASLEMGLSHPRLMGTKEFDSIPLKFLSHKTLNGLYCHYASKLSNENMKIHEFIMNTLNIPKMSINPHTQRLATLDSASHRKYFDSMANLKSFINQYLEIFDLQSLCKKYTMIRNAKKAGIYIRGLITVIAPLSRKQYLDYLYEILKNTPRDLLFPDKQEEGDFRLRKSDLYALGEIEHVETDSIDSMLPTKSANASLKQKSEVLAELQVHKEILSLKQKKYHEVPCTFLLMHNMTVIFFVPVFMSPGDVLISDNRHSFEVIDCRERTTNDGYVLELKPLDEIGEKDLKQITTLEKDSNETILMHYMSKLCHQIENDTLSPLHGIVLGLQTEQKIDVANMVPLHEEGYRNPLILENAAQRRAVDLACTLDGKNHSLAIVQGPPGTGKTTLIKEIALQYYYAGKNVLILAKTNVAVDNILEKLVDSKTRFVRSGNNIEAKSNLAYAHHFSTSNWAYMETIEDENKIVLGTPLGFFLDKNLDKDQYDIVIIDEASQMDLPETLFALGFSGKCVMIGDHLQIPPFPIPNEVLMEFNSHMNLHHREELQQSLFEKLITDEKRYNHIFLDINYRTENPKMVSFISDLIYDGRLSPNTATEYYRLSKDLREDLFPKHAIEIIDTAESMEPHLRMETEINSTYFNFTEAVLSVKRVQDLLKEGEALKDICVLTPYKAHVEKLKEVFLDHSKYLKQTKEDMEAFVDHHIYTVDAFQGREQKNVIINWVRSNYDMPNTPTRTGFLKDYRRINVALSRAKKRLILIGDFETLVSSDNTTVRYIFKRILSLKDKNWIIL